MKATYYSRHKEAILAKRKEYYEKNTEKVRQLTRKRVQKFRERNPDYDKNKSPKQKARCRIYQKQCIEHLSDWYVRELLSRKSIVTASAWPESAVELKRAQIKIKRICQNQKI